MTAKSRRRQRSTRITVSVALVVLAGVLVAAGLPFGRLVGVAGVAAVVLGAAATRIMHSELMLTRLEANRDRARQARDYRALSEQRVDEHRSEVDGLHAQVARREAELAELEQALIGAQHRAADATRKLSVEARRAGLAEDEAARLTTRLDDAEERAAEAVVRLAELEQEVDALRSEVVSWRTLAEQPARRHA